MRQCALFTISLLCAVFLNTQAVRVSSCSSNPSKDVFRVDSVEVHPNPIQIPGDFTFAFSGTVLWPIGPNVQAEITLRRKLGFMWIDLPCINIGGAVGRAGSCTYRDICSIISSVNSTGTCPRLLTNNGIPCSCPIQPGSYRIPQTKFSLDLSKWGINLPTVSGEYQASFRLRDTNTREQLLCYDILIPIEDPPSSTKFGTIGRFFVNLFG